MSEPILDGGFLQFNVILDEGQDAKFYSYKVFDPNNMDFTEVHGEIVESNSQALCAFSVKEYFKQLRDDFDLKIDELESRVNDKTSQEYITEKEKLEKELKSMRV